MNANTRLRLWKETRALLPMWAAVAMLMTAPRLLLDRNPLNLSNPAYWLACALLGAASFSHDFQYRTMGLLLAQPVSRRRIWWEKHIILGLGLTGLLLLMLGLWFTDPQAIIDRDNEYWRWILLLDITPIFYAAFIGFTTGPALALLTRTLLGGATLALACPWILYLICRLAFPPVYVAFHGSVPAVIYVTFVGSIYCGLLFLLGCRRFERLEDVNPVAQEVSLPPVLLNPFAWLVGRLTLGRGSALGSLVRKEVRLQMPACLVALGLVALWLVLVAAVFARPTLEGFLLLPTLLLCLGMPVIAGIVSTAEERNLGVHEWHLTVPVSARRLWTVKVLVALGVNVTFGILLPGLLAHASSWLADNPQLVAEIPGRNVSPFLIANLVIFCAALYASTASSNSMRALVGAIVVIVAGAMVMSSAIMTVEWVPDDLYPMPDRHGWWPAPELCRWAYEAIAPLGWGFFVWIGALSLANFRRAIEAGWGTWRRVVPFAAAIWLVLVAVFTFHRMFSHYDWTYYEMSSSLRWESQKRTKQRAAERGKLEVAPTTPAPPPAGQILFCKLIEHQTEGGFWFSMLR